jgi:predicted ArsR family transcriptional regulator
MAIVMPTTGARALTASDLNVTVNHEPRIHDLRLAEVLGFANKHMIRVLIRRHLEALKRFGEVSLVQEKPGKQGGRPGISFYLNKRQALYITAKSDTPRAAEITVEMVEVFDAYLAGKTAPAQEREAPKAIPRKFDPGSDLVRDLATAVQSANVAVERGREQNFGVALERVLWAIAAQRDGNAGPADVSTLDWNFRRVDEARAKLRVVDGARKLAAS